MVDLKTQPTDESVERYLEGIEDPQQKDHCRRLLELMRRVAGESQSARHVSERYSSP